MSESENRDYYTNCAATARRLAENAADKQIANIHHEMAARYEQLSRPAPDNAEKTAA